MSGKSVEPVRKQLIVEAPQERAFRVFTENIDRWWPRTHKIGKAPLKAAVLEPRENGRWYEVGEDGSQCDWGRVLAWEPPRRLVLAWQVSAQWQFDASLVTEVEVTFTPEGPRRTRVDLEHRDLERFGPGAEQVRGAFDSQQGWGGMLESFARVAAG